MSLAALPLRVLPVGALGTRRAGSLIERNLLAYRRGWVFIVSGFLEPVFYLFAVGVGVAHLVGTVDLSDGRAIDYTAFVAPAMLAASAMNGAIYDSTFNIFFKLKYEKLYDAVLATPVTAVDIAIGEIGWALMRGGLYSTAFLLVMLAMGLVGSWWALLVVPAALVVGLAFAAVGMAATTYMRSWQDFEFVVLATLPMFLFSATFYPLSTYPEGLQWVVRCSPLYQAADLIRDLTTGDVSLGSLGHVAFLGAMALVGLVVSARRLEKLLLT